jgi:hypothetical protein
MVKLNIYSALARLFGHLALSMSKYPENIQFVVCTCPDYETYTLWSLALGFPIYKERRLGTGCESRSRQRNSR